MQRLVNIFYSKSVSWRIYRKHLKVINNKKWNTIFLRVQRKEVINKKKEPVLRIWLNNTKSKSLTRLYTVSQWKSSKFGSFPYYTLVGLRRNYIFVTLPFSLTVSTGRCVHQRNLIASSPPPPLFDWLRPQASVSSTIKREIRRQNLLRISNLFFFFSSRSASLIHCIMIYFVAIQKSTKHRKILA